MLTSSFFAKTHKTLIFPSKTEVRSRSVWPVGPLLGLKIASVRRPGAHETLAGLVFQAHNGLKCHSMRSKVPSDTSITHVMPKPWNHWFYHSKTHTFRCSQVHFCTQKNEPLGSNIAPSATTVTASSSSVANRGAHKTIAGLVFQAHNGLKCHPMRSKCLIGHIHTSCHAQTMESLVLLWDNSHFSKLTNSFLHPKYNLLGPKLHLQRLP